EVRNGGGFKSKEGELVIAFLVDNWGYASDVAQKFQGYLLSESKVIFAGKTLPAGAYGIGFLASGEFAIMDIGGNDVLRVPGSSDAALHRPVPLQIAESGAKFRLYFGRKYVEFTTE